MEVYFVFVVDLVGDCDTNTDSMGCSSREKVPSAAGFSVRRRPVALFQRVNRLGLPCKRKVIAVGLSSMLAM